MKIILVIIYLFCSPIWAEVLVPAPDSDEHEYRALLQVRPELMSPVQKLLRNRPGKAQRKSLLRALNEAQDAFLNQSFEAARDRFRRVAEQALVADWRSEDLEVIQYAFLRLAQLEIEESQKQRWLERAANLGGNLTPDASLFPPPLLGRYLELSRKRLPLKISDELFKAWPTILINGQACTRGSCEVRPSGKTRVTWLSDRWAPVTRELEASEINKSRPHQEPWFQGSCGAAQPHTALEKLGKTQLFWSLSCEHEGMAQAPAATTQNSSPDLQWPETPAPVPALIQKKWLWAAGLGAIALAVLISGRDQAGHGSPTTVYE